MKTFTPRADVITMYPENERDVREILEMNRFGMGELQFDPVAPAATFGTQMRFVVWPTMKERRP